jgi:hypothetical protein
MCFPQPLPLLLKEGCDDISSHLLQQQAIGFKVITFMFLPGCFAFYQHIGIGKIPGKNRPQMHPCCFHLKRVTLQSKTTTAGTTA